MTAAAPRLDADLQDPLRLGVGGEVADHVAVSDAVVVEVVAVAVIDRAGDTETIRLLAVLEALVHSDHASSAVHQTVAAILDGETAPDVAALQGALPAAEPPDRNRLATEVAEMIGRRPDLAAPLAHVLRQILAAAPA